MVFLSKQMNLFKMFIESKSKESDESVDVEFDVTQLPPLLCRYAQFCEQATKVDQKVCLRQKENSLSPIK